MDLLGDDTEVVDRLYDPQDRSRKAMGDMDHLHRASAHDACFSLHGYLPACTV